MFCLWWFSLSLADSRLVAIFCLPVVKRLFQVAITRVPGQHIHNDYWPTIIDRLID